METESYQLESKEKKSFFDPEGNVIPSSSVYFRQNGKPYLLACDEEGKPEMTRIPLEEASSDTLPSSI